MRVIVGRREDQRTAAARVRDALRIRITSGDLVAGARLREEEIAARHGVSRTPVREALRHLAAEGLVRILPHAGAQVAGYSLSEIDELFEIRTALQVLAITRAVERVTPTGLRELRAQLGRCEIAARSRDLRAQMRENAKFHGMLHRAAASPQLEELLDAIDHRLRRYRAASLSSPHRPRISLEEHKAILAAMARRDIQATRELVSQHSENARTAATRWYLEQDRRRSRRAQGGQR